MDNSRKSRFTSGETYAILRRLRCALDASATQNVCPDSRVGPASSALMKSIPGSPAPPPPPSLASTAAVPSLAPALAWSPVAAPSVAPSVAPPEDSASADEIHSHLRAFVSELEQWATSNAQDARRDTIRFWSLKIPAVLSSASAGALALAHLNGVAVLATAASACILIEAVNPGGQLRNAHLRAVHDLRELEHHVMNEWRIGALRGKSGNLLAAEILQSAQKARDKVAADLRVAETSFACTVRPK